MKFCFSLIFFLLLFIASCATSIDTVSNKKTLEFINNWYVDTFTKYKFEAERHELAAPFIVNNDIFQGSYDGNIYVINKTNGVLKRVIKSSGKITATPLYSDGNIYFGTVNGTINLFSYRTGEYGWEYQTDAPVYSSPSICESRLFVLSSDDTLHSLNPSTGKLLWHFKRTYPSSRPVIFAAAAPVCYERIVYVGFSDGYFAGFDAISGNVVFEKNIGAKGKFRDIDASPYVDEKVIIVPSYDGSLYCLDRQNGSILWEIKDGGLNSVKVNAELVYFTSNDGYIYVIRKDNAAILWKAKLNKGVPSTPAIMNDYLIVASSNYGISIYDIKTGEKLNYINVGKGVFTSPIIDGNNIIFISGFGVLHSINIK